MCGVLLDKGKNLKTLRILSKIKSILAVAFVVTDMRNFIKKRLLAQGALSGRGRRRNKRLMQVVTMVGAGVSVAVVIVVVVVLVVVVVVMGCGGRGRDRDPAAKKGEMVVAAVAGMVVGAQMVSVSQEHTESQSIEVAKRVVQRLQWSWSKGVVLIWFLDQQYQHSFST